MSEYVVEAIDLNKKFKDTYAVSNINMKIRKCDIYGFIGSNGAGKSTTLKMIAGLMFPTSGEIKLFGEKRNVYTPRRIGALIENAGIYPHLSAYDNMDILAASMGLKNKQKLIELLNLVHLDPKSKKKAKKFSLGMKQRLGIAMALLGSPDLLILDEPINGLDPEGIREIREVIQKLNEEKNMTIIISSHILGELSKVATRYGIIRSGKMIEELTAKQLGEKCRNYISIVVQEPSLVIPVLEKELHICDYLVHENNEIRVFDDIDSMEISLALARHQVAISQIVYQKQDLESYFLEKIGKDGVKYD